MGPDEVYTMFQLDGRDTGGCYKLKPEMLAQGVPPNWMLYVSVPNADETAAKVEPAGGKVLLGPFAVMDFGRMAVLQDPTGAVFAIWQAGTHTGVGVNATPGTFCWADLMTNDQQRAAQFYGDVLGWTFDPGKDDSGYLHVKAGEAYIGGILPPHMANQNVPPHWLLYMQVADCDASTAKATAAGATVFMPAMTMEGVGRWSVVGDPQGAVLALFQPAH